MEKTIFLSNDTDKLLEKEFYTSIKKIAFELDVDSLLVTAIIKIESNFYPFAFRYEPQLKKTKWYLATLKNIEYNDYHFCSYGLMQVLFGIARNMGYEEKNPFGLFEPKINIFYGIKLLKNYIKAYPDIKDVISSYNQGSPKKNNLGIYYNQEYVNKVYYYYQQLKGKGGE